ncbi:glycosyltransferase [Leptospira langatensis]|uniref:Glycosyltransferase n=1 Tax=Leptospira langatensis TaxID=2484983 RepID=A0A5F1ZTI0_9LEPT|nr:glycosyltransferase family 4 protein [Leptospira langatensis]TGK02989.1 glycosyltransferase [Leptospira langatensis]TGL41744.1 glycosyltransferase [Leptospira langatensis]
MIFNKRGVHQFAAGFNVGDAISNEMSSLKSVFRKLGYSSEIFAENTGPGTDTLVKKYKAYAHKSKDILVYHHSIHSEVLDTVLRSKNPKILVYHNVTPDHFFEKYDLKLTYLLRKGREELEFLRDKFDRVFAVSEYNKAELIHLGFENVGLLPITYQLPQGSSDREKPTSKPRSDSPRFLFVGRITPNKKQDDLIRFAYRYLKTYGPEFQLFIVGFSSKELYLYREELERMLDFYKLRENVIITDFLSDKELKEMYLNCDLFLSMSEHEGFCVPLLEAMVNNVPILAFDGGAVKETLAGAGVLFKEKRMDLVVELAHRMATDESMRNAILETQERRLQNFSQINAETVLRPVLAKLA